MTPAWSALLVILTLCSLKPSSSQFQVNLDCLPDWEIKGHHCYKLVPKPLPWASAERTCASYGGHLALPSDYYENEDIGDFVNSQGVNEFWLGTDRIGVRPNDNDTLFYNGGLETRVWIGYWSVYQPKFTEGDCVYVSKDTNRHQKWSFGPCERSIAFLCQRPVCAQGSFHCVNGHCISPKGKCDGYDDCGDRSDETDCPQLCSWFVRTSGQGIINYPNNGLNYSNNAACMWLIETDVGSHVQLTVTSLSLENNSDELIVMDGGLTDSSSLEIIRLSGHSTVAQYFYSSDNKMLVKFRSDGSVTDIGFSVSYSQVNSSASSQNLTARNTWQELEFPYYNSFLLGNQDISYVIEAEDQTKTVTFEVLDIDLPVDATAVIRDGNTVYSSILARLSGTYKGSGFTLSSGRYLRIELHTVRGSQHRGLRVRYMQGCQASLDQSTGYISSPGYPVSFYPNGITCNWIVSVPGNKSMTILFNRMDIHISDRIQIMMGNTLIGSYSGNSSQIPLRISGGQFSVVFISSATLNKQGFNLTYSVDCPQPAIDPNISNIDGAVSVSYGSEFTVTCKPGSQFFQAEHMGKTNVTMICMAFGQWNVNTSPKCERIQCQKVPSLQNGYLANSRGNLPYNGTLTYKCYQGYMLVGSDTVTCDVNGHWINLPSCQASSCGVAPAADPNGNVTISVGNGSLYGTVLRYSCNQGYDLIGDPTLFCDSNGRYVGKPGTCKILTCYTSDILNGVISSNKVQVGQQITLNCNPGYRSTTGENSMTCYSNRTLLPGLSCQNINECNTPSICQHQCIDTEGSYYCTCNPGFEVVGNLCRDIDECQTVRPCNDGCTNTPGSYQCSCQAGYSLFVANGTQGHWIPPSEDGTHAGDVYHINHTCVRNFCPSPPVIANTFLLSQKTGYYYEDVVMYRCQLGYILENPMANTLTCSQNGTWTGLEIKCSRVACAVEPVATNLVNPGKLSPNNTSILFGEVLTITCDVPGFTPQIFTRIRQCTLVGSNYILDGSINDYECGFISCGKPQDEPGSIYTNLSTYYYGNSFTFTCRPTFKLGGASFMTGNTTVTCQRNGQWDFGNLTCTGAQCMDPGQPYLGKQVLSDYREGQLVIFSCLKDGYTLRPPYPISCGVIQNGTPRFNGSLPACIDTQAPNITNCPQNDIIVARQISLAAAVPELQIQDNGGIKKIAFTPGWPSSQQYATSVQTPVRFTYTVTDYENNQAECDIRFKLRDDTPPKIICPLPYKYQFRTENDIRVFSADRGTVIVTDDGTPAAQLKVTFSLANYTFNPKVTLPPTFPPIVYKTILATAEDAAGNSANCSFELLIQPDACSPYSLHTPANSIKTCVPVGSGYNCIITCNRGYSLYNNILSDSVAFSCPASGQAFAPVIDVKCVNTTSQDGSYKLEFDFLYEAQNTRNSCKDSYETTIRNTLQILTTNKNVITDTFCETGAVFVQGKIALGYLTVRETENKVLVHYVVSFDRKLGSNYSKCAAGVKFIMGDPYSYLVDLIQYKASTCDPITLTSNRSLTYEGYYCEDNTRHLVSPYGQHNLSYCLACPEGSYLNSGMCLPCPRGTFGELPGISVCQQCPNNTSTYSSGAVSRAECASGCDPGFSSASGLPPCDPCPPNTFWVNATTCLPCPPSGVTRGGGAKNQMDCKAPCLPGTFNEIDGHEHCKTCPLHHYSSDSAFMCTECPYNTYTNSTGKTSTNDCLQLSQSPCASLCQNGRCVDRLPHIKYCFCSDGWTGEYCNKSLDPCASHPCYNGGTCTSNGSKYNCSCPAGTQGTQCQNIVKTCTSDYCQNNGMCENLVSRPVCHCLTGFTGDRCQTTQNICASQPCKNGGNCTAIGGVRFSCSCQAGFTGSTCEENKDDCYESACRNNGTCRDGNIAFTCDCGTPYTGRNCETRNLLCSSVDCGPGSRCLEDEMNNTFMCICNDYTELDSSTMTCKAKDLCARNPCLNNGSCTSTSSSVNCMCPAGYGGSLCQLNINDCLSMPCQNGGRCQDLIGTFYCNCSGTGFQGDSCNLAIDDCASQPCNANGTVMCVDMANAYHCHCRSGYAGENCEIDINECDSDPCLHNATCLDSVTNYTCQCPVGWTGRNCETENMLCTTTTCLNGAMCVDYFNGYFCTCTPNTYEKNCSARVNICQVTNPCIHGSCQDNNGSFECKCDDGYEGDQCGVQQYFCNTNMNACKNGGQCVSQLDSYECKCPQGYTGKNCSVTVDNSSSNLCPFGSTCLNVDGKIYCRCPLDKEGQNCDKEWDQDFDLLFDHEHKIGMAYLLYPIELNNTAFSISLWLQFGEKDAKGTVLSLLTVPDKNSLRDKHLLLWIDEKTIYFNGSGTVVNFTHDTNYRSDGLWHYLVVNVNLGAGVLHFIVDTVSSEPVPIPVSTMYTKSVWVVLGSLYDPVTNMPEKDKGFYGKLSKVTFYSLELQQRDEITFLGNTNVSTLFMNSIIRWNSEFKYSNGVIRMAPSEADRSCPFGFTNYRTCDQLLPGKRTVKIANGQCPNDILHYSSDRLTQVFWSTPTFSGQESLVSSFTPGDTFEWGKYSVVIQASNSDGNTELCLFNIFVQNDNCTTPKTPPMADGLQCSPAVYERYKQCDVICKNNTAPSIPSPRLYTCGPDGNWDPNNKFVPFRISPCGAISQPSRQTIITLKYSVPTAECTAVKDMLERELLKTLMNLNNEWSYVCTQANCSDANIVVTCLNTRRRRQAGTTNRLDLDAVLTLNNIPETVTSKSNGTNKRTEDLFRDLLLALPPANSFNYSNYVSDAAPTLTSFNDLPLCTPPKVFQENQCVDCGPGTFYNDTERECQFCPFGSYQPNSGETSCDPCPTTRTTPTTGSVNISDCYDECPPGQYMNLMSNPSPVCTNCSRGLYQPRIGQFRCLPCPADKTTKYTGTILESDCANDCPPGQEIGSNNNCTACRIGFYRGPNDAVCQRCPNNTVTQNTSQVSVAACNVADNPPGTKRVNTSSYVDCPIGTYQSEKWQSECIPCAANYLTDHARSTNVTDCKFSCPAGQEKKPSEDSCMLCQIGYFRDGSKPFDQCKACLGNFTTLTAGSTSEQNCVLYRCSAGEQPNNSSNGCDLCPMGTYQEFPDMPSCNVCSSGNSTRRRGATKQDECEIYCPSGYENNGTNCTACQRGYYKDNAVDLFLPCTACDSKYVTPAGPPATNASQCVIRNCQAGSYINGDNCTYCPKGSFQDQPWQTNCTHCGPNRTTETDGATSSAMCLLSCPAGTENTGQSTTCDPCMVGYYKDVDAAVRCTPCGNFSENDIRITTTNGSTNITNCTKLVCLAGYYPVNEKCIPCDFGTYQTARWADTCTDCPLSHTTYIRGAVSASDCEYNCSLGEELVNGTCIKCAIGFYNDKSNTSRRECFPCPGNQITQQEGATSAEQCNIVDCSNPGQFRDIIEDKCKDCPIGKYQGTIRQTSCSNCPQGSTTQSVRSTSVVDCKKDCDSGYFLDNNTNTCMACPVGSYRNKTDGNWNCVSCGANLTTPESGSNKSSDCSLPTCSRGYAYDKSLPVPACIECPVNSYSDREGQLWPCTSCPNDQFTDSTRSTSLDQCHYPCSAGNMCNRITEVCVNVQSSYRCDCQSDYQRQNNQCIHKCDIPNYCGSKGECIPSPFECRCRDGYSGTLCDIRPDASTASDQETETIIIAVVTTVTGLLFIILLIVCICVMIRKRSSAKTSRTSEIDEHTSITTRSMTGYEDYPTFAINPAFSSKPPSMYSSPNGALASQGIQMYSNPTYSGDEDNDPAVYRA